MNQAPASLIEFSCASCHTVLSVPGQMAGITGPCPHCHAEVTAPTPFLILPAQEPTQNDSSGSSSFSASEPPSTLSRTLVYGALIASSAGLYWALQPLLKREIVQPVVITITKDGKPFLPDLTNVDPRTTATKRGEAVIRNFMMAREWKDARALVAPQDITGSISEPRWHPEGYQALLERGNFTPMQITDQDSPGEYEIVWNIESAGAPDKLVITTSDTPEGPKVRWVQPPVLRPVVDGTHAVAANIPETRRVSSSASAALTPENAALAAASIARPEGAPQGDAALIRPAKPTKAETEAASNAQR